ncbi:MAG: nicotinate (nicotinamide) nucleotide adenylyltransferase [Parvularculales bacterium]
MRIGLLGGSFNPAHKGHLDLSLCALARLDLHQVWWVVSPRNPLKETLQVAPYEERLERAHDLAQHPAIVVSDIEYRMGLRYTIDTITALQNRNPGVDFVLLLGADNVLQLPHWRNWRKIIMRLPLAVMPRAPYTRTARTGKVAQIVNNHHVYGHTDNLHAHLRPPALIFLEGPENPLSSTALRNKET